MTSAKRKSTRSRAVAGFGEGKPGPGGRSRWRVVKDERGQVVRDAEGMAVFEQVGAISPAEHQQISVRGLKRPLVAHSLPLNHPDAPHLAPGGEAVFTSDAEIREFCRKTGYRYGETTGRKG